MSIHLPKSRAPGVTVIDGWIPGTSRYEDLVERGRLAKNFLEETEGYKLEHTYLVWC